jgi:ABC-2 type transport system ATP-binding protein
MPATFAIEMQQLAKHYGEFPALSGLSLSVQPGEVFGLLGPNGAGKTTTLRLLMGMLVATSGRAQIQGLDCLEDRVELKRRVGYLPDHALFYDYLTGRELLRFVGQMHGLPERLLSERSSRLLEDMALTEAADEYVVNYSLGMQKKMALCLALIHEPSVLILDEPTTGLDPLATRQMRDLIRSSAERGRTVLLSTHLLDMAERVCDRVAILHHGRLAALGTPDGIRNRAFESGLAPGAASLEDAFLTLTSDQVA